MLLLNDFLNWVNVDWQKLNLYEYMVCIGSGVWQGQFSVTKNRIIPNIPLVLYYDPDIETWFLFEILDINENLKIVRPWPFDLISNLISDPYKNWSLPQLLDFQVQLPHPHSEKPHFHPGIDKSTWNGFQLYFYQLYS